MKTKPLFALIIISMLIIMTSCSANKTTLLEEVPINFNDYVNSYAWSSFTYSHDYHFQITETQDTWVINLHFYGHFTNLEPSVHLGINNHYVKLNWHPVSHHFPYSHSASVRDVDNLFHISYPSVKIRLETAQGISEVNLKLPYERPEIVDTEPVYKNNEEFTINWQLQQVEDFQSLSWLGSIVNLSMPIRNTRVIDDNSRSFTIYPSNFDEQLEYLQLSISNVNAISTKNHLFTATKSDEIYLKIE